MKLFTVVFLSCLLLIGTTPAASESTGHLTGQLKAKTGKPLAGGLVFFFSELAGPPPSPDKYWRVPNEIRNLDNNGNFKAKLAEGRYFIGAIQRISKIYSGPPCDGELYLIDRDASGIPKLHVVKKDETINIGASSGATPFKNKISRVKKGTTAIEGTVTDAEGKPVAGTMVFAFVTPETGDKPLFFSQRTGEDGKYLLRVSGSGSYFLKVRDVFGGGTPVIGSTIGRYGGVEHFAPVQAVKGTVVGGIDIETVKFEGKGKK